METLRYFSSNCNIFDHNVNKRFALMGSWKVQRLKNKL